MAGTDVTRKLAAILYADVAGYSRLTGSDEEGTHKILSTYLDTVTEIINNHSGRVLHYAGDAVLAEFDSVVVALNCALEIQSDLSEQNESLPTNSRVEFRIGINLGDVIVDRGELYGDGVNIAARLETLAQPGGICISSNVYDQVEGKMDVVFEDIGLQEVKNIARSVHAYTINPSGVKQEGVALNETDNLHQEIKFCIAPDGVQIAYSTVGEGPPLFKSANWLNHLEFDWESPVWRHVLHALAQDHCLIRYDQRGNGLSDWDVEDTSFEAWVRDLEAVADAAGFERFPLLAVSQGCSVAIDYAVRHPERVSHLVLYGGYMRGRNHRNSPAQAQQEEALIGLIRSGWGQDNPAFRQVFTSLMVPGGTAEQMDWFNDLQRNTTTPENAIRIRETQNNIEVSEQASRVIAPTLVLHVREDAIVPFEEGRRMAATIPGAKFVALEGRNHLILENEPAWPRFLEETRTFLATSA
jgi:class 3 adenylate cyclase/pimeloyl-ACP methyl ester carboxylesterase